MGGFVEFTKPIPSPEFVAPDAKPSFMVPPPSGNVVSDVEALAKRAPTPLDLMLGGYTRLHEEAVTEAKAMHGGRLKNGALNKFMLALDTANKAAKYMHTTKIDAQLKGSDHEADLALIMGIAIGKEND